MRSGYAHAMTERLSSISSVPLLPVFFGVLEPRSTTVTEEWILQCEDRQWPKWIIGTAMARIVKRIRSTPQDVITGNAVGFVVVTTGDRRAGTTFFPIYQDRTPRRQLCVGSELNNSIIDPFCVLEGIECCSIQTIVIKKEAVSSALRTNRSILRA